MFIAAGANLHAVEPRGTQAFKAVQGTQACCLLSLFVESQSTISGMRCLASEAKEDSSYVCFAFEDGRDVVLSDKFIERSSLLKSTCVGDVGMPVNAPSCLVFPDGYFDSWHHTVQQTPGAEQALSTKVILQRLVVRFALFPECFCSSSISSRLPITLETKKAWPHMHPLAHRERETMCKCRHAISLGMMSA